MLPRLLASLTIAGALGACPSAPLLTREQLMDPAACQTCHAQHVRDWSGSMHAYAAEDPVFIAMNARGQRETGGALGSFCVNCHAPLAVLEGATKDGLNLSKVPQKLRGVTCFFCHSVDDVTGTHNGALHLAADGVLRGPLRDPSSTTHGSTYSRLHDRDAPESSGLCGGCHDVVNPKGAAIERTFLEWQGTVFSHPGGATCGQCHMNQSATSQRIADVPDAPSRRYHAHGAPGVDVALTPFPESDQQRSKVAELLGSSIQSALCVGAGSAGIQVILDNVAAGHGWPSGAAQDRRAWVEVIAYSGGNAIYASGAVADGEAITKNPDPDRWLLRDCLLDEANAYVPMFWQATSFESHQLPGQVTFDALDPRYYRTHIVRSFPRAATLPGAPDRVTMRVRFQPIGLDVIDDLIGSGDLDPAIRAKIPTFDVGATVEWTPATGKPGFVEAGIPFSCATLTNLNYQGDRVPAASSARCVP